MDNKFTKTKLASAVSAAALAMAVSAPSSAVVVVGGDNGWEVSFDGNVNLFYNNWSADATVSGVGGPGVSAGLFRDGENSSHLNEGLLPAFFSFTVKSPTVNGLTGSGRISFAPDSSNAKDSRNDKGGSAIDMREVVANVDGSFGTFSFGRTLGLYQRQAILSDHTLFGVGAPALTDGGGTTLGRIGYGYIYPEFRTRFAYKTPNINGFQVEVGAFDPQEPFGGGLGNFETDTPQIQVEATYATSFTGGTVNVWGGILWQDMEFVATGDDVDIFGWEVGAKATFGGFHVWGHYYDGEALGTDFKQGGQVAFPGGLGAGVAGVFSASSVNCSTALTPAGAPAGCSEAENDGFVIEGGYTFAGKTKVAISYGETNQDSDASLGTGGILAFNDVTHEMWSVGVYHDVTSWLKLVAEYNDFEQKAKTPTGAPVNGFEGDGFSIGGFFLW